MSHQLTAGIILGCASAASANAGVVIEKIAMRRMPAFEARNTVDMVRRLLRSPVWVLGFSMIAAGLVIQLMALSLASISVVQAVAPAGTVLLLVLSHVFLGDRLRRAEYVGIGALVAAFVLLMFSINANSDRATGSARISMLLAITLPTICLSLFCFASANRGSVHRARAPLNGLATGLLYGCAALDMKWLSTLVQRLGVGRAVPHILVSPVFYMFLGTSVLAFLMFQFALQRSVTSVLVPVSSLLSTAFFIVVGDALFHEHLPTASLSLALRLASFACLAFGLLSLAGVKQPKRPDRQRETTGLDAGSVPPAPAFDTSSVTPAGAGSSS
jgi:drug/metabolite transporter (DMT)-like permease